MELKLTKEQYKQVFIESEKNCSLCGSPLHLDHKVDFVNFQVVEESTCKSCGVRNKKRQFSLN